MNIKKKNITEEETSEEEITITYDDEFEYDLDNSNECLEWASLLDHPMGLASGFHGDGTLPMEK